MAMTKGLGIRREFQVRAAGSRRYRLLAIILLVVSETCAAQAGTGAAAGGVTAPVCGAAQAGSRPPNLTDEAWCTAIEIVKKKRGGSPDASLFTEHRETLVFLAIVQGLTGKDSVVPASASQNAMARVVVQNETKRTDKQIGASAGAQGSTSAAEKAGFTDLLGVAIENGTIQQATNGTTLTLSSSPYALTAWAHGDTATNYLHHEKDLARIGASATFNISDQQDVLNNVTRRQLAEWSVRVRLSGDHSTRSSAFGDWWQKTVALKIAQESVVLTSEMQKTLKGGPTRDAISKVEDEFFKVDTTNPAASGAGFVQTYLDAHATAPDDQLITGLRDELLIRLKQEVSDKVDTFGLEETTKKRIVNVVTANLVQAHALAAEALLDIKNKIDELNLKPVFTLAYTNVRNTATSDYSVVKLLLEKGTSTTGKLAFNVGTSFYSKPDKTKNEQTVRDYAAALSWETLLGRSPLVLDEVDQGQMTLSFSGRYQRLLENRHQAGKKADLAVAQVKFEIPVFSGVTFPISVSYATASELLKEDHVHANFGFSFDTDKLYQLLDFKRKQNATQ